jgi:hypothetical protein
MVVLSDGTAGSIVLSTVVELSILYVHLVVQEPDVTGEAAAVWCKY